MLFDTKDSQTGSIDQKYNNSGVLESFKDITEKAFAGAFWDLLTPKTFFQ
jgi:hypothetical protein